MKVNVISPTIQEFNGERFYLCGNYFQHQGKRLHITVWKYHNGEILKGYNVHHIDEDRSNNQIENLCLMPAGIHQSFHQRQEKHKEYQQKHIKDMRELASEWHKSDEGRKWHSEMAKKTWENVEAKTYVCGNCGKTFESRAKYGENSNHFCSNSCKAAWRRKQNKDMEERKCAYCGKTFLVNRYAKTACCSRECAVKKRWSK